MKNNIELIATYRNEAVGTFKDMIIPASRIILKLSHDGHDYEIGSYRGRKHMIIDGKKLKKREQAKAIWNDYANYGFEGPLAVLENRLVEELTVRNKVWTRNADKLIVLNLDSIEELKSRGWDVNEADIIAYHEKMKRIEVAV